MCWSVEASIAMCGIGAVATAVTYSRRDAPAIWLTLGYFSIMEALQIAGYAVINECGTQANEAVTWLSYLHIVFQPFLINAFAMELVPETVKQRIRMWVFGLCGLSSAVMLAQLLPVQAFGSCLPGSALCAQTLCTVSGDWHIAWDIPYNGLTVPFERLVGMYAGFPTYMLTVFVLPFVYGAWRFTLLHLFIGPILARALTANPNEMPAIWCLFSIGILLIGLSPIIRRTFSTQTWWSFCVGAKP